MSGLLRASAAKNHTRGQGWRLWGHEAPLGSPVTQKGSPEPPLTLQSPEQKEQEEGKAARRPSTVHTGPLSEPRRSPGLQAAPATASRSPTWNRTWSPPGHGRATRLTCPLQTPLFFQKADCRTTLCPALMFVTLSWTSWEKPRKVLNQLLPAVGEGVSLHLLLCAAKTC